MGSRSTSVWSPSSATLTLPSPTARCSSTTTKPRPRRFRVAPGWRRRPGGRAGECAWWGFDLVSTANNHAFDYGAEGLANTLKALAGAGLAAAGTGENLARARAPAYFATR